MRNYVIFRVETESLCSYLENSWIEKWWNIDHILSTCPTFPLRNSKFSRTNINIILVYKWQPIDIPIISISLPIWDGKNLWWKKNWRIIRIIITSAVWEKSKTHKSHFYCILLYNYSRRILHYYSGIILHYDKNNSI